MIAGEDGMLKHLAPQTVYGATWADDTVYSRCRSCGLLEELDVRRLALDGHGRERLTDIPFECECGSTIHDIVADNLGAC
jgi:hypothetical protein